MVLPGPAMSAGSAKSGKSGMLILAGSRELLASEPAGYGRFALGHLGFPQTQLPMRRQSLCFGPFFINVLIFADGDCSGGPNCRAELAVFAWFRVLLITSGDEEPLKLHAKGLNATV